MNKRIQELAEQARTSVPPGLVVEEWIQVYNIKLGQLIVRECLRMCDCADVSLLEHNRPQEASGASSVKQFIKEWFGVEE